MLSSQVAVTPSSGRTNAARPMRRSKNAVKTNPASGMAGISGTRLIRPLGASAPAAAATASTLGLMTANTGAARSLRLLAHGVVLVDERRAAVPVDGDDNREAHCRLGGGHGHDHQGDDGGRAVEGRDEGPERDDRQVHRVEHQPDREEDPGDDQVGVQALTHASRPSRFARKMPPITAMSRSTLTTSNGRMYEVKRRRASASVPVAIRFVTAPQSVALAVSAIMTARTIAAIAAGSAWAWKTSRTGAFLACVSITAKRIRTAIAPM